MDEKARSLIVSFGMLVVAIAGLVVAIVVLPPLIGPDIRPPPSGQPVPVPGGDSSVGGTLTVTGDREGTLRVFRESGGGETSYGLEGGDGRIMFATGSALSVSQISYDGWSFFPDEGQCTLAPEGHLDTDPWIGIAELRCDDIEDIRDNGSISLVGQIGLPIDLLIERTLPEAGGALSVGDEMWDITEAVLVRGARRALGDEPSHDLALHDMSAAMDEHQSASVLNLDYDVEAGTFTVATIERQGEEAEIPVGGCEVRREVLGEHDGRIIVVEVMITCGAVDVPGLGAVPIEGTVVVDEWLPSD